MNKNLSNNYLKIGQAAKALGVSIDTLRRWEKSSKIKTIRTPGGTRLYHISALRKINPSSVENFHAGSQTTEELLARAQSEDLIRRYSDISGVPNYSEFSEKRSFVTKFTIGIAVFSVITLILSSLIIASYLAPKEKLPASIVQLPPSNSNILAVTASPQFLEINSDTQINGSLSVQGSINELTLEATPSGSTFTLTSGGTTLTVTKDALLDQDVSTTSSPTFSSVILSASTNQITSGAKNFTLPGATTTLIGTDTTQTLTNKSLSGSSNTFTNIPNSALTNSKVTVTAGTNLSGGGDVSLGGSITLSLASSPSISGVVQLADGTAAAPSLTFTNDTDTGLYRIGSNRIGLITGGSATSGITIDSSGNVGIGNITPSATLYVSGNVGIGYTGSSSSAPNLGLAVQGNVGIGTTSPNYALDVVSNVGIGTSLNVTSAATLGSLSVSGVSALNNVNAQSLTTVGNAGIGGSLTTTGLDFASGGIRVNGFSDLTGNVGIGGSLTVTSLATFTSNLLIQGGNIDTSASTFNVAPSTTTLNLAGGSSNTGCTIDGIGNFTCAGNIGGGGTGTQGFWVRATTPVNVVYPATQTDTLGTFGNVGVSTTNPHYNLDVNGTGYFSGFVGIGSSLNVSGNVGIGGSLSVSSAAALTTLNVSGISSLTGNVGIGGSLTANSLSTFLSSILGSDGSATAPGYAFNLDTDTGIFRPGTNALGLATAGSSRLTVTAAGLIGIGITSPAATFQVNSGASSTVITSTGNVGVGTTSPNSALSVIGGGVIGTGYGSLIAPTSGLLVQGLVGIGTTAPVSALSVNGNVGVGGSSAGAAYNFETWGTGRITGALTVGGNLGIGTSLTVDSAAALTTLNVSGISSLTGNVGIGGSLTANSLSTFLSSILGSDGSATAPGYAFNLDTDTGIFRPGTNALGLATAGSSRLTVTAAGLVGIGITSPAASFQVNSGASSTVITSSGNLGIGTTSPNFTLDVVGNAGIGSSLTVSSAAALNTLNVSGISNLIGNVGIGGSFTASGPTRLNGLSLTLGADSTGDIFYRDVSGNVARLPIGASGQSMVVSSGLPVWTDTTSFTSAAGWVDAGAYLRLLTMGDNVGIGTTVAQDPIGKLHLRGNADATGLTFVTTNNANSSFGLSVLDNGNVGIGTTLPQGSLIVSSGNVGIGISAPSQVLQINSGASSVVVTSSGNLGIGITTPLYPLHVLGNVGIGSSLTVSSAAALTTLNVSGISNLVGNVGIGSSLTVSSAAALNTLNVSGISNLVGNVGIGGSLTASGPTRLNGLSLTLGADSTGDIFYRDASGNIARLPIGVSGQSMAVSSGLPVWTDTTSFTSAAGWVDAGAYLRLLTMGDNVGIGTTIGQDPYAKLHIRGNGTTTGLSFLTADNNNIQRFAILDNGNVGIGTTAPNATLSIQGNLGIGYTGINQVIPSNGLAVSGNVGIGITTANSTLSVAGSAHIGSLFQGTAAPSNGLFVDGNVGIGATTSNNLLDVWGNVRITGTLTIDGNSATSGTFTPSGQILAIDGTALLPGYSFANDPDTGIFRPGTNSLGLSTGGSSRLTVTAAGFVGIGITSPAATFQVNSGASSTVITSTGNVGVGTTSPLGALHVVGQCVAKGTRIRRKRKGSRGKGEEEWEDVPVEDIKPDDEVLSLNEKTGAWEWNKVEKTMDMGIQQVYRLETDSGKWIETTANHPYLVKHQKTASNEAVSSGLARFANNNEPALRINTNIPHEDPNVKYQKGVDPTGVEPVRPVFLEPAPEPGGPTQGLLSHKWIKVSQLKVGQAIATEDGWEKIVSIQEVGRKQTYDLQIESTHNFLANNIVAHNTYITGNVGIGATSSAYNFETWGTGRITSALTVGGNLGIGTSLTVDSATALNTLNVSGISSLAGNVGIGGSLTANSLSTFLSSILGSDGSATAPGYAFNLDTDTGMFRPSVNALGLSTAGTSRLTVTAGGNVGIGITAPSGVFQVGSSVTAPVLFASSLTGNVGIGMTNPQAPLKISRDIGAGVGPIFSLSRSAQANNQLYFVFQTGNSDKMGMYVPAGSDDLRFIANGSTDIVTFTNTGNVGIGITTANSALSVAGSAHIGTVRQGIAAPTDGLFVDGNVGIGATSTAYNLDLWGTGRITGALTVGGNLGIGTSLTVDSATALNTLNVTGISSLAGNVGIGGSLTANSLSTFLSSILGSDGSATAPGYAFNLDTDTGMFRPSTNALGLSTAGTSRLTVTAGGNVGIGITAPSGVFQVGSSVTAPVLFASSLTGNVGIGMTNPQAPLKISRDIGAGGGPIFSLSRSAQANNQLYFVFQTGNSDKMGMYVPAGSDDLRFIANGSTDIVTFTNTGNVGIGITTANSALSVAGGAHIGSLRQGIAAPTNGLFVDGNVGIGATTSNNLLDVWGNARITGTLTVDGNFSTNGTITPSGQFLAIDGTAALPGYSFVNDTDTGLWRIGANQIALTTGGGAMSGLSINSSGNIGIGNTSASQLFQINSSTSNPFVVTSAGNVGIGYTVPKSTLYVNGGVAIGDSLYNVYNPPSLSNGLVGYWKMDESSWSGASGEVIDSSGTGNNGTANGGVTTASGKYDRAGNFDGTDDYVDAGTNASLKVESAAFSVALWLKTGSTINNNMVMSSSQSDGFGYFLALNRLGSNNIDLGKAGVVDQTVSYTFSTNTWYHIVAIQNFSGGAPSNVEFFINGSSIGTYSNTTAYNSSTGKSQRFGSAYVLNYFNGLIDEARIYNRVLSAAEISYLYNGNSLIAQGRVGIGTTSPNTMLEVIGNGIYTANFMSGNVGIGASFPNSTLAIQGSLGIGYTGASSVIPANGIAVSGNVGIGITTANNALSVAGAINIGNALGITAPTNGALISGNVGIGGTSAGYNLDTWGTGRITGNVTTYGTITSTNTGTSLLNGTLQVGGNALSAGVGALQIEGAQQTQGDARYMVDILDTAALTANTGGGIAFGGIYQSDGTSANVWASISGIRENDISGNLDSSLIFTTRTGSAITERLRINSQGFVGIGTTVPNARLSIQGNVGIGFTGASQVIPSNGLAVSGNMGIGITTANSTLSVAGSAHIGSLRQGIAAPTDGLFVDGNVGIGATTSNNLLDVWGNSRITGTLNLDGNSLIGFGGASLTGPTNGLAVSGNVGIGTTSPRMPLEIWGNGTYAAALLNGNVGIGSTATGFNNLQVEGSIGIGTSYSPGSYKLDVAGTVRAVGYFGRCGSGTDATQCNQDVAEIYDSLDDVSPGDLLSINSKGLKQVKKTNIPYDNSLIGIVSSAPGLLLGLNGQDVALGSEASEYPKNADPKKPAVALTGKVPVKVSMENGPIEIGDYLTSSSTPGIAMKATRPGSTIGKALEGYSGQGTGDSQDKILVFVNISYADPGNFFASLSLDNEGNLIIPKIKTANIILDSSVASASASLSIVNSQLSINEDPNYNSTNPQLAGNTNTFYDLTGKIASLEDRITALEAVQFTSKERASDGTEPTFEVSTLAATSSAQSSAEIATASATTYNLQPTTSDLNLTPPDILLATGSATLANLKVTSEATVSGRLLAYDLNISNSLKSLGETTIGNTIVAGHITVDGTLSIENGSEINVLGTLFLQKTLLAEGLDIFNGKVTINKEGNITTQGKITASEIETKKLTISNTPVASNSAALAASIGTGILPANTDKITIPSTLVTLSSKIFITPISSTDKVLSVTNIKAGESFDVSVASTSTDEIKFNWWIIQTN